MIGLLKKHILPLICKALKFFGHFLIPKISLIVFLVVPFLYKFLDTKIALILWVPSLIIFVIESVCIYRKQKYKPEQTKPSDIFMRGFSFVGLYFFLNAFLKNYKFIDFSWHWIIAVTAAFAVPFALCNTWKYFTLKNNDSEDKIKEKKKNLIKYILFYLLVDAFYVSLFTKSLVGQFITGGLCMISIFTNLATLVITRKIISKIAMLQDFIAGIALTVYLIYIIPNPSIKNIVLVLVSALYGGLMTLVGVAWTIKDGQRREAESKRLEKIPYLEAKFGEWMLKEERGSDIPDLWLIINRSKNDSCSSMGTSLEIRNIGLGMATELKCKWISSEIIDDKALPITLLKCDDSYRISVLTNAAIPEKEIYRTDGLLIFEYQDLLGNQYNQELNITFEVHRNYTTIISHKISAPHYIK